METERESTQSACAAGSKLSVRRRQRQFGEKFRFPRFVTIGNNPVSTRPFLADGALQATEVAKLEAGSFFQFKALNFTEADKNHDGKLTLQEVLE